LKKKGSFGAKKTRHDEVTDVTNIGSAITSGGDLTLVSGGDQRYQGAKLNSGNDLTLDSGGSITFEAVKDRTRKATRRAKAIWPGTRPPARALPTKPSAKARWSSSANWRSRLPMVCTSTSSRLTSRKGDGFICLLRASPQP